MRKGICWVTLHPQADAVGYYARINTHSDYRISIYYAESLDSAFNNFCGLADDFRTIDWATEYPYPTIALQELKALLA